MRKTVKKYVFLSLLLPLLVFPNPMFADNNGMSDIEMIEPNQQVVEEIDGQVIAETVEEIEESEIDQPTLEEQTDLFAIDEDLSLQEDLALASGDGSAELPFTAGNATELKAVLATIQASATPGPYHINLTDNIVHTQTDVFMIYKDVVIDGQGYHMLYANNASQAMAQTGFRVHVSGVQVTFRNLNFGSDVLTDANNQIYANNTYYGIIMGSSPDGIAFHATIENVHYNAVRGGQPFLTWNRKSSFTFKGENSFTSKVGTNSQEFLEGYNVTFAEGSVTTIDHQTDENTALFFAYGTGDSVGTDGRLRITIERNAKVEITSKKQYFSYDAIETIFTIEEGATFDYTQTGSRSLYFSNGYPVRVNIGNNARVSFVSGGVINSGNTVSFYTDQPDFIDFQNVGSTNGLFGRDITFNRLDDNSTYFGGYHFTYLDNAQNLLKNDVSPLSTVILRNTYFSYTTLKRAVYQPRVQLTDWSVLPEVDATISQMRSTINGYQPSDRTLTTIKYKVSNSPLWTGSSITDTNAQQAIESANLVTPGLLTYDTTTETTWDKQDLLPGTYYVYAKVTGVISDKPDLALYKSESLWMEQTVEISRSPLSVEVPMEMFLAVREIGPFSHETKAQPIINRSNFAVDFTVKSMEDRESERTISLVDVIDEEESDQMILNLAVTNGQLLGPLLIGEGTFDTVELAPFLSDPLKLYLNGIYQGNLFNKHHIAFGLTYLLTAQ